ncbi:MAG: transposase [Nitrospinota bacterium]|nr:transposase [Nitrospinota bacterium]
MMSRQSPSQNALFHYNVNLEERIPADHDLRRVSSVLDLEFVYARVQGLYGRNGNESVPPPVILKLMLLLIFYNVRSERELLRTLPYRMDWLWFLGYGLDDDLPHHSVLSKARNRWGEAIFQELFERTVRQCVESGLVDGEKLFMDSSLVDAHASKESVVDLHSLPDKLARGYETLCGRLEESESKNRRVRREVNDRYRSTTDPDAAIVQYGGCRLRYKVHRSVDPEAEVITSTEVTRGDVDDSHRFNAMLEAHRNNTGLSAKTVVADSKYGTVDNFLACKDQGIQPHMPDLKKSQETDGKRHGIYSNSAFTYDPDSNTYTCPAGKRLHLKSRRLKKQRLYYAANPDDCNACELKSQCTQSNGGRTVQRYFRQEDLENMRAMARTKQGKQDLKTRQHLMERSFAYAVPLGFKKARWRRLWRVRIQEYLTATIQNIKRMIKRMTEPIEMSVRKAVPSTNLQAS